MRRIFLSKPVVGDVNQDIKGRQIHTLVKQKFLWMIFKTLGDFQNYVCSNKRSASVLGILEVDCQTTDLTHQSIEISRE